MSALGHERTSPNVRVMSALPSEADMLIVGINVCYVPFADMAYGAPKDRTNTCL